MITRFEDYKGSRVACALRHVSKAYLAINEAATSLSKRKLSANLKTGYGIMPLRDFSVLPPIDCRSRRTRHRADFRASARLCVPTAAVGQYPRSTRLGFCILQRNRKHGLNTITNKPAHAWARP